KLNRLEDAENAFLKALELTKDNPKINFYLGSIYERLHRFKDAIYQYRQAGANLMVRRVEDKIAQTATPSPSTTPPVGSPRGTAPFPAAVPRKSKKEVDTAEYKAGKVAEGIRAHKEALEAEAAATLAGQKIVEPVSATLMAEGAPKSLTETARFRLKEDTLPPNKLKAADVAAAAAAAHEAEGREKTTPPSSAEPPAPEKPAPPAAATSASGGSSPPAAATPASGKPSPAAATPSPGKAAPPAVEKTMPPATRTREIFRFLENN